MPTDDVHHMSDPLNNYPPLLKRALEDEWSFTVYLRGGKSFSFKSANAIDGEWVTLIPPDSEVATRMIECRVSESVAITDHKWLKLWATARGSELQPGLW